MSVSRRWQLISCWHLLQSAVCWGAVYGVQRDVPLGTRSRLEGRWLINSQPLYIMSYQLCWQYEAQWYPALWTQLACDGCRNLSEVNSHFLATDTSFLCTWIQRSAPQGRCWNINYVGVLMCTVCYPYVMYTWILEWSFQHQGLLPYFLKLHCVNR
jgi:hypothetical protein